MQSMTRITRIHVIRLGSERRRNAVMRTDTEMLKNDRTTERTGMST